MAQRRLVDLVYLLHTRHRHDQLLKLIDVELSEGQGRLKCLNDVLLGLNGLLVSVWSANTGALTAVSHIKKCSGNELGC